MWTWGHYTPSALLHEIQSFSDASLLRKRLHTLTKVCMRFRGLIQELNLYRGRFHMCFMMSAGQFELSLAELGSCLRRQRNDFREPTDRSSMELCVKLYYLTTRSKVYTAPVHVLSCAAKWSALIGQIFLFTYEKSSFDINAESLSVWT